MQKLIFFLTLTSSLFLVSCTSNEGAVKKAAVAEGERQFTETLTKESQDFIQSVFLRDAYVSYMKRNSEFDTEDVKVQGELFATAVVTVKTYSPVLRRTVARIANGVEAGHERQFNFGNAISLVAKQTGTSASTEKQPLGVLKFQKNSSGDWLPQAEH